MKKKALLFLLMLVAIGGLFASIVLSLQQKKKPRRMEVGELITQPGKYVSPKRDCFVYIWEEKEGKLKFNIYHEIGKGSETIGPANSFDAKCGWFICWDSQGRLWTYTPEGDARLCHYYEFTNDVSRCCSPGVYGGWEGIPETFLAKLPEATRKSYKKYLAEKKAKEENSNDE